MISMLFLLLQGNISLAFDHSYPHWASFLDSNVSAEGHTTSVKYKNALENRSTLQAFLTEVSQVTQAEYVSFSREQKLALLINAYNAFTIELVLKNWDDGKIKSIKDTGSLFQSAWKKKFFVFLGEKIHLDHLEHELARAKFPEPRLHFAFNCASKSCPKLQIYPYLPEKLDDQLEKAAIEFLSDKERNRWNEEKNMFELSAIFKWYGNDFKEGVQKFVSKHMPNLNAKAKECATQNDCKVSYLTYDWSLNRAE